MRGLKPIQSARIVAAGHAFVPNLRRGQHELTSEIPYRIVSASNSPNSRPASETSRYRAPAPTVSVPRPTNATPPVDRIIDVFKMALLPAIEQLAGSAAPACW
jgi:hypothetical protein